MTNLLRLSLLALLGGVFAAQADELRVCIEDRAEVGFPARAGLVRELHALLPNLDIDVVGEPCHAARGVDVHLSLLTGRPGIPSDALGLAYHSDGVIQPRLEVFVDPVVRLTGAGDWETVGRALARVAAHELLHYSRQTSAHSGHGLMQAKLSASELVNEDARPRLVASLNHD